MDHRITVKTAVTIVLLIAGACGEIDPGISPTIKDSVLSSKPSSLSNSTDTVRQQPANKNVRVAIVGGGFAGLAAFGRLHEQGYEHVELFEAADRLGGRVYPVKYADGFIQHGAQFINGMQNPIFKMASGLGVVEREMEDDELFRNADYRVGSCSMSAACVDAFEEFVAELEDEFQEMSKDPGTWNRTVGAEYGPRFEGFIREKAPSQYEMRAYQALSNFYKTYYEGEWGSPIDKLSLRNYATWSDESGKYASYTLDKFGYTSILHHLISKIPAERVHLNSKVARIDYSGASTKLNLVNGMKVPDEFDVVIVTVSLGHLKAHASHLFEPKLPPSKMEAIDKMGFGSLLKVFLEYDQPFWSNSSNSFVPLHVEGCAPDSYLARHLHTFEPLEWRPNVLVGWLSGDAPNRIDWISDEELAQHITEHFRNSMPGVHVPHPRRLIRTSWLRDDNFRGSYSYIADEAAMLRHNPVEVMSRPVFKAGRPRILFAGEATHTRIYQTTTGAYLSGRREVDRISHYFRAENRQEGQHERQNTVSMFAVNSVETI